VENIEQQGLCAYAHLLMHGHAFGSGVKGELIVHAAVETGDCSLDSTLHNCFYFTSNMSNEANSCVLLGFT
jgi:hypothetical protein